MRCRRLLASVAAVAILASAPPAHAQNNVDENLCYERIAKELVIVHDDWRSRLFGSRIDREGVITALTAGEVDDVRTGIFETKGRMTSELIEPIVESYRVYRCRSIMVCETAAQSLKADGGTFDLHMLGCAPRTVERYSQCHFSGDGESLESVSKFQQSVTNSVRTCQELVDRTLAGERAMLRLAVAYDSGYRSLLQLAGMVDWMLEGFPTETVKAISDMVNMLGKLHQIPCFIGQCDNPDTDDIDS